MPTGALMAAGAIGGALIGANASSKASDKASQAATQAADQNNATQRYIFDTTNQNYQPYRDLGSWAIPQLERNMTTSFAPTNAFQPVTRGPNATIAPQSTQGSGATPGAALPPGMEMVTMGGGRPSAAKVPSGVAVDPASAGPPSGGVATPVGPNAFADPSQGAPGATPGATATQGQPDWDAYIQQHPDVAQWIQQGHGDPSLGPNQTPEQAAQFQYENSIRLGTPFPAPPMKAGTGPGAPDSSSGPAPFQFGPDPGAAPTFAGYQPAVRPDQGSAPGMPDLSANAFEASPGYEYALKEGLRGVNAYFGAKGVLNSGGALQEAIRQGQGMAQQDYYNWQNSKLQQQQQAFNQFAANRANTNTNYDVDTTRGDARTDSARNFDYSQYLDNRNYNTGRFDQQNANLTGLVGIGAGATGAVANAGNAFATGTAANNNSAASATGNAAIAGANNTNALIGNAFQSIGMYAGLRGSQPGSSGGGQYGAAPISYPSSFNG